VALANRQEMIARELTHLAREPAPTVSQKQFGFAEPAGIEEELTGRRIAGRVFETEAEIGIAEGYPAAFPVPAYVYNLLLVWQQAQEAFAGFRCGILLKLCFKVEGPSLDVNEDIGLSPSKSYSSGESTRAAESRNRLRTGIRKYPAGSNE